MSGAMADSSCPIGKAEACVAALPVFFSRQSLEELPSASR